MAGRPKSRAKKAAGGGTPKVPCTNRDVCGVRNHQVGTFSQLKCEEISRRRAKGETITAESAVDIRPPSLPTGTAAQDATRTEMDRLRAMADEWKHNPLAALEFVSWASKFTDYSPFNRQMIYLQNPEATSVGGKGKWKEMGREISEDAKPIGIFVPGHSGTRDKKDKDGKPVLGPDGKPEKVRIPVHRFKTIDVWDIADTEGDTPPDVETQVLDQDGLHAIVSQMEGDYGVVPTEQVMAGDIPARYDAKTRRVTYNAATKDPQQQMVNRLVATAMAASAHLRYDEERRMDEGDKRRWGHAEHMYAGIAAAHALAKEAGVDLTDLAVQRMSEYEGKLGTSTLTQHADKISTHIDAVRMGLPVALADAMV